MKLYCVFFCAIISAAWISCQCAAVDPSKLLALHRRSGRGPLRGQPPQARQDFDDDYFQAPAWGEMGQSLNLLDEETYMPTGWKVALSTDGQTLAQVYPITNALSETVGFKFVSYVYVPKLLNWIPFGHPHRWEIPAVDPETSAPVMDLAMTNGVFALSYAYEGDVTAPNVELSGKVHVMHQFWSGGPGRAYEASWVPMATKPIENKSPDKKTEMFGITVALAGTMDNFMVAVGTVVFNPNSFGRVEVYTDDFDDPDDPWKLVGNPIVGDHDTFGLSVEFSQDGGVLAVLGSYISPTENDDENETFTCLIRTYEFSEQAKDWVQLGQDIKSKGDDDKLSCSGVSLSADGTTLVSGPRDRPDKASATGHVRVWSFSKTSNTWEQKGVDLDTLVPDLERGQMFGPVTAISDDGNRVAVSSADGGNSWNELAFGSIYTFEYDQEEWKLVGGAVTAEGTPLSMVMANGGNTLAYGSPFGLSGHGAVAAYTWVGTDKVESEE